MKNIEAKIVEKIQLHHINARCCDNCKWFDPMYINDTACMNPKTKDSKGSFILHPSPAEVCMLHEREDIQ